MIAWSIFYLSIASIVIRLRNSLIGFDNSPADSTEKVRLDVNLFFALAYRTPDLSNPYGKRTNWGEKVFVKADPATFLVLNIPTGAYIDEPSFPAKDNLIGLPRILATLPSLLSNKFEGALFPIELANGIASMSSYPSAKILQRFIEDKNKGITG